MSNELKISDYLHLYIGCKIQHNPYIKTAPNGATGKLIIGKLIGIVKDVCYIQDEDVLGNKWRGLTKEKISDVKPILRPLSSMTEDEAIETTRPVVHYGEFKNVEVYRNHFNDLIVSWGPGLKEKYNPTGERCWSAQQFHYLLSKGFDLWNLIGAGLAIDAKILSNE